MEAEFQYRHNDPSENVQVDFRTSDGITHVLSFVATCPHWCEEAQIYGDLFAAPLSVVFEGGAVPLAQGSKEEADAILSLRQFVEATISDYLTILQRRQPRMTESEGRERLFVWFLGALERRRNPFHSPSEP